MAKLIGELLLDIISTLVRDWAYSSFLKLAAWLVTKIQGRRMRIAACLLLGLAAYFLIPIFVGLLGL